MQIAVLSDLHLGCKDVLDRFGRQRDAETRLLSLLKRLERNVDRIVLLGDIFETLRGRLPGSQGTELHASLLAYPQIAHRALYDPRYQFIRGNHDAVARRAFGVPDIHRIHADGVRLLFFHGHQLDTFARGRAPFSRGFVWFGGWLERVGIRLTQWLDHFWRHRRAWQKQRTSTFARAAVAVANAERADVVVTGHTHAVARFELGSTLFMNSGSGLGGRQDILILDTRGKTFEIHSDDRDSSYLGE